MDKIKALLDALKLSPGNIPLQMLLAQARIEEGHLDKAIEDFKRVIEAEPSNFDAKFQLAKVYQKLSNNSAAIIILEELTLVPEISNIEVYQRLSKLYLLEGNHSSALSSYKKVLEFDPEFKDEQLDAEFRMMNTASEFAEDILDSLGGSKINFSDVGGMEGVKKQINLKIIQPLKTPELYAQYGKKIGGGILLYGPPGCGKTYIAKATAGEVKANFISVGVNEILDMWIGGSERNLHSVFENARVNNPSVLFFDEVDALGASRTDMRKSGGRHLINQFLMELDGEKADNEGILVIGATNAPWHLDSAFRRPGRFDRIIFVPPPDQLSREKILQILLKDKPTGELNYSKLAAVTKEFSGADLQGIVDQAIESKLELSLQTGNLESIEQKDLLVACKNHQTSTKEWFNTAKNYAVYANQSGIYDEILSYLNLKK